MAEVEWRRVAREDEVPPGTGKVVEGPTYQGIALYHLEDGWYAIDNTCPHAGMPIGTHTLSNGIVTCMFHGIRFDVRTGVCPESIAFRTHRFQVELREGEVLVGIPKAGERLSVW
jgi:nitrite reductase (NADH) small subunit